ncbi:glycoside hydrolase family 128 protein [Hypholoma sublateritium FD-334 SS-4]|uniref:Glycoside hydrolase family 128 protein n=1 Tax=Hypholoma sublateritium (strain FD-334 SS-4) TaxID=945553 RepID=A0A0D2Q766_HYPSF|nr:glycoside hydrolase family 128 protein [Hypholoma sublateritium FD-334 SS-4]
MHSLLVFVLHLLLLACSTRGFEKRQDASSNITSKAGLAWPNGATASLKQFEGTGRVTWYYTWSAYPIDNNIEFVPMFWGKTSVSVWTNTAKQVLATMSPIVTAVLGMNEPELASQANLTVQEGVDLWKTYIEPLRASGYRLGSPGPSSSPAGKVWLQDFIKACNGECTIDFISTHWYGTNTTLFQQHVEDYYNTFQKPLWITEWACQDYVNVTHVCSADEISAFMNVTQAYLDSVSYVERYAWFGAQKNLSIVDSNNAIMDDDGIIDQLGKQYINYTDADGPIDTALPTFSASSSPTAVTDGSSGFSYSALLCTTAVVASQLAIYLS